MTEDCPERLKLLKLEISKLQAYNNACEAILQDIEVKLDQEINKKKKQIQEWKRLDPKCDTSCTELYIQYLIELKEELFE